MFFFFKIWVIFISLLKQKQKIKKNIYQVHFLQGLVEQKKIWIHFRFFAQNCVLYRNRFHLSFENVSVWVVFKKEQNYHVQPESKLTNVPYKKNIKFFLISMTQFVRKVPEEFSCMFWTEKQFYNLFEVIFLFKLSTNFRRFFSLKRIFEMKQNLLLFLRFFVASF